MFFDQFVITPRLAILSPVRGCGKTILLTLLELLSGEPFKVDHVSAAAIYNLLAHRPRTTLLVDEADNLGLLDNRVLRSVFNSGHRRGGGIARFVGGWPRKFPTFAPLAVAAIGVTETLPLPLMHRSVIINMQRFAPSEVRPGLRRLDENDRAFAAARTEIGKWAEACQLAPDPAIPPSLRNRAADNFRSLISIADDLGHGEAARAAAIELNSNRPDEDAGVTLLTDIRGVFLALGVDRIPSAALVKELIALEDGRWGEWRGQAGDRSPHKLSQAELASMLRSFQIRPKTIWPARRRPGDPKQPRLRARPIRGRMVGLLHIGRHSDTGQQNHSVPPILIRHTARTEIDAFLKHVRELDRSQPSGARGRLIFALDATASREPTWDIACQLQGDMFAEAAKVGGLDIQLVYYRGSGECRTSRFTSSSRELAATMQKIQCRTGYTHSLMRAARLKRAR